MISSNKVLFHWSIEIPLTHHRKRVEGSILPFASLPLPTPAERFLSTVTENCAGTSSEITLVWDSEFPQALQKDTLLPETTPYGCGDFLVSKDEHVGGFVLPFLHHARQTSETCYRESLLTENQHGSFKYLSYILFSNRYMHVFFSLYFRDG